MHQNSLHQALWDRDLASADWQFDHQLFDTYKNSGGNQLVVAGGEAGYPQDSANYSSDIVQSSGFRLRVLSQIVRPEVSVLVDWKSAWRCDAHLP